MDLLPVFRIEHALVAGWRARLCGSLTVIVVIAGFCWSEKDRLIAVYNIAAQPAGGETNLARYRAINKIRDILGHYDGPLDFAGVAHDLAIPAINGRRISYWLLNALPGDLVGKSDVLVFWKPDYAYDMKYMKREPSDPAAFDTYNRIREGKAFGADGKPVVFRKVFEDGELEVYGRTEAMTVRSASTRTWSRARPGRGDPRSRGRPVPR